MKSTKATVLSAVLAALTVSSLAAASYFYYELSLLKKNPQRAAQSEVRALIGRVGDLMILPSGEEPTVATVSDPEKLRDQLFFANAKKGYKVLIYPNARKAILYDPQEHKIVEVAPVNIGNPSEAAKPVSKAESAGSVE
ncbi:hypothetical protein HYT45_04485 [Candidatus Uhrbacteria bacterium]|nr:hypothetical protein [Candidatus Uhrbacteria bacterium]